MQVNTQLIEMVSHFAKANKISKAKLQEFAEQIISSLPKENKENTGKVGRPMLEKTSALHSRILDAVRRAEEIKNGGAPEPYELNLRPDAANIRKHLGEDKVTFNNALSALVKHGKIYHAGKAKTGSRGRQPFILSTVKGGE